MDIGSVFPKRWRDLYLRRVYAYSMAVEPGYGQSQIQLIHGFFPSVSNSISLGNAGATFKQLFVTDIQTPKIVGTGQYQALILQASCNCGSHLGYSMGAKTIA